MAEDGTLDWLNDEKKISVNVTYDDPTPTPPLAITPGDTDSIVAAAKANAIQMATKMYGKDVRGVLAQWILTSGELLQQGVMSLQQFEQLMNVYQAALTKRMETSERLVTDARNSITDAAKEITDAAAAGGEAFALEVQQARTSSIYGEYPTLKARLDASDARYASTIPGGFEVTIAHGAGRAPDSVIVDYYTDAIGTETNGLGTSAFGLGGSDLTNVPVTYSAPDGDTIFVALPKDYEQGGVSELHADGYWYVIDGNKVLRFRLLGSDGEPISSGD